MWWESNDALKWTCMGVTLGGMYRIAGNFRMVQIFVLSRHAGKPRK